MATDPLPEPRLFNIEGPVPSVGFLGGLPCGGFLMFWGRDGGVWYQRAGGPSRLLVPSACDEAKLAPENGLDMCVSLDLLSDSSVGDAYSREESLFPTAFNMAVLTQPSSFAVPPTDRTIIIQIWRVDVEVEHTNGEVLGYSARLLGSFIEPDRRRFCYSMSLHGTHIAYFTGRPHDVQVVFILDWTTCDTANVSRVVVSGVGGTAGILLPNDYLFISARQSVQIWSWGSLAPTPLVPEAYRSWTSREAKLLWASPSIRAPHVRHCNLFPYFVHDSTRIVIPSYDGLLGFKIPLSSLHAGSSVTPEMIHLSKGPVQSEEYQYWFGYRAGIQYNNPSESYVVYQYSWEGQGETVELSRACLPSFEGEFHTGAGIYYDDAHGCLAAFGFGLEHGVSFSLSAIS
ncbi:hypothetical protein CC2G_000126 [Coprinopsis cinerea AmutBmut pab1-1]|nr:hypothetical protein CC2G_000126 [Coprinopsis cinerea AmutBmut pab1-1]